METSRRRVIKRRNFGVKRRRNSLGSKSGGNSTKKDSFFDRTGLKQKNKALAATLNNTRLQNAALCQKLNQMNGEIFEVKGEIVELKREKQAIAATARLTESDIQRKLEEIVGPIKTSLQQAYNHTLGLSENISNSLAMLESLQKHSNRGSNRLSDEIAAGWFQKSPANHLRQTPQASVPPRVMGFEIQTKPKIRMTRLDMSALQGLVPPVAPAAAPEPPPEQGSLEENVQAEAEEEEEEVEVEQGETVLLFPRLVLERIRLTPSTRPSSRRQSEDSSNRAPSPVQGSSTIPQQAPDTPRSRESFEDFTRRIGGLDPMEGPSWLFSDAEINNGPRQTKSRDEKRKENSLKARLSSASRKLSIDPENEGANRLDEEAEETENEDEAEPDVEVQPEIEVAPEVEVEPEPEVEPRRRGGARAAATAARSSLKEPTLGSKLRQGDRASNSVYDDFVPGTKRKSDRKSAKGTGVKKKKSSNGK